MISSVFYIWKNIQGLRQRQSYIKIIWRLRLFCYLFYLPYIKILRTRIVNICIKVSYVQCHKYHFALYLSLITEYTLTFAHLSIPSHITSITILPEKQHCNLKRTESKGTCSCIITHKSTDAKFSSIKTAKRRSRGRKPQWFPTTNLISLL